MILTEGYSKQKNKAEIKKALLWLSSRVLMTFIGWEMLYLISGKIYRFFTTL